MNKFDIKDLVNAGVFSVLIIITYFIAGAIFHVPFLMPFLPFAAAITGGIAYMVYTTKIKKPGMISITMVLMLFVFIMTGHGIFVLPGIIISAIFAEYILYKGKYNSLKYSRLSYVAFNFFGGFMFLPIFIAKNDMKLKLLSRGKSVEYVEKFFSYFPDYLFPIIVLLALAGGYIGGTIGINIIKRHFKNTDK